MTGDIFRALATPGSGSVASGSFELQSSGSGSGATWSTFTPTAFFGSKREAVRPDPRNVPGDVLRASPARLSAHALGRGIGKPFQGLKTPLIASRVARPLRPAGAHCAHVKQDCRLLQPAAQCCTWTKHFPPLPSRLGCLFPSLTRFCRCSNGWLLPLACPPAKLWLSGWQTP